MILKVYVIDSAGFLMAGFCMHRRLVLEEIAEEIVFQ